MTTKWTREQQAEHRRLWVEALRSGRYQQTAGALRDSEGFCCLGVACDISGLGKWKDTGVYTTGNNPGEAASGLLPISVQDWLGLPTDDGMVEGLENAATLAELNDDGVSFEGIANLIEGGYVALQT